MGLESLTGGSVYINSFINTNPVSDDYIYEADDHLRGVKNVILNTFPNITGAMTATQAELNSLAGRQAFINTFLQAADATAALAAVGIVLGTGDSQVPTGANLKAFTRAYTKPQSHAVQTLADGATVTWDITNSPNAEVTLAGNRTLALSGSLIKGQYYTLAVIQDGTGSRTLAFPAEVDWGDIGAPTLSTVAGSIDILTFYAPNTSKLCGLWATGY